MIVDGRKSQWNVVKTVVLMLQVILFPLSVGREMLFLFQQGTTMKTAITYYLSGHAQASQQGLSSEKIFPHYQWIA